MLTLFIRSIIIYIFMFAVIRLMGKRQLSDMQPFDLVVTLLIANLASVPTSDPSVPLVYGVVTILGLFIMQRLVAFISLKSEKMRKIICGDPLVVISKGLVREDVMKAANYLPSSCVIRMFSRFQMSNTLSSKPTAVSAFCSNLSTRRPLWKA